MSASDFAIRIKGIGKQYRLGLEQSGGMYRYKSLRDSLGNVLRAPMNAVRSLLPEAMNESNSFWALRDVSFDVKRGEVVGIIGRNGAGKSTLLKILSRITRPTTGEIELHGRVGSLLEVGTGFHPELSGRENIYLNGAVLGMTRAEVKRKFDEIVAFSEIEKFIDTPVKQYSSGMYTRLAFAVAAHLEPEILVVDEVLAVGDAEFQRKCIGKMQDVARHGRTVLYVSHDLGSIQKLCSMCVFMENGKPRRVDTTYETITDYLRVSQSSTILDRKRPSGYKPWIRSAVVHPMRGERGITPRSGIEFVAEFSSPDGSECTSPVFGVVLRDAVGSHIGAISTRITNTPSQRARSGRFSCGLPKICILPGRYVADFWLGDGAVDIDCVMEAVDFTVNYEDVFGSGQLAPNAFGPMLLEPTWLLTPAEPIDA